MRTNAWPNIHLLHLPLPSPFSSFSSFSSFHPSPLPRPQPLIQLLDPRVGGVGHEVLIEESVGQTILRDKGTEGLIAGTVVAETVVRDDKSVLLLSGGGGWGVGGRRGENVLERDENKLEKMLCAASTQSGHATSSLMNSHYEKRVTQPPTPLSSLSSLPPSLLSSLPPYLSPRKLEDVEVVAVVRRHRRESATVHQGLKHFLRLRLHHDVLAPRPPRRGRGRTFPT